MIRCIADINLIDINEWEALVNRHPDGNIFQTPMFFNAINSTNIHKCISAFAVQDNKLKGVLIAVLQKEHKGIWGLFSLRSIVIGGPIVENNDKGIALALIVFLNNLVWRKTIYTQYRNLYSIDTYLDNFISNGFIFEEHLNIIVNLEKDSDVLWSEVHSKRRNEIRRSKKEGAYFEETSSVEVIEHTHKILKEVYKKAKLPLPDLNYFNRVHQKLGTSIFRVFVAKYNSKIIGTMYTLCYKDTIYDWYAGSYIDYYNRYPNDLIIWEVFQWGKGKGYKYFDFGGAGKPGVPYGVRDYKKKFGGSFVSFGRYEKINKPILFKISKVGFAIWKMIR